MNKETLTFELSEFMQMPGPSTSTEEDVESYRWTYNDTLIFLDLYQVYRKQVGTLRIKSLKKMFEEISKEIKRKTGKNISATNYENRWRVLERAYKKYVADSNKTGAARKELEYADVMHEILGQKRNVHPLILLSSKTVAPMSNLASVEDSGQKETEILSDQERNEVVLLGRPQREDNVLDNAGNNPSKSQTKVKTLVEKKKTSQKNIKV